MVAEMTEDERGSAVAVLFLLDEGALRVEVPLLDARNWLNIRDLGPKREETTRLSTT
jgi:hypothetical protein